MSRVFIVAGLGYGDEGKGTAAHWLAWREKAQTVVRTGGPQAMHRVVTARGAEHVFSQFGSASLVGAATHLSRNMLVDPDALLNEGRALQYEHGLRNIFDGLSIHKDALIVAPFQAIANRVRELARGAHRHGSVGIGVGEAIADAEALGDAALRARDLASAGLQEKLESLQARKLREMQEVVASAGVARIPSAARDQIGEEMKKLAAPETVRWAVARFREAAKAARIVDTAFLAEKILGKPGAVVFEGSQGVLLDPVVGFRPFTTSVRTVPAAARELVDECGRGGDVQTLGVIRAYHTRHGAGPLVTECPDMTRRLPDPCNGDHPWQGAFRVGALDLVALRYAIAACGGPEAFDGLILTCVDRVHQLGSMDYCDSYSDAPGRKPVAVAGLAAFAAECAALLSDKAGVPVFAASIGPTEQDKLAI